MNVMIELEQARATLPIDDARRTALYDAINRIASERDILADRAMKRDRLVAPTRNYCVGGRRSNT
jgi:hypothetical protein